MATSESIDRDFTSLLVWVFAIALILMMAGCAVVPVQTVRANSEIELAMVAYKAEWLKDCEGDPDVASENAIVSLLQDYTDAQAARKICMERHNGGAAYLRDAITKWKAEFAKDTKK